MITDPRPCGHCARRAVGSNWAGGNASVRSIPSCATRSPFGYNVSDNLPASAVLADGIGQCNTKGTLLMALLRGTGIPCRLHGFTIDKRLQNGPLRGLAYWLAPRSILHSWVEARFEERWVNLEGFILDRAYLGALQQRFADHRGLFCGYGVATQDLQRRAVDWNGDDTYIQKDGINHDFGVFESPDAFYARHGVNLRGIRRWLFERVIRQRMNRNIESIRRAVPTQNRPADHR
jgi:hypothetical protein